MKVKIKKNDDCKEKMYKELLKPGADAEAFRRADLTEEELTKLVSGLRRALNKADKGKKKSLLIDDSLYVIFHIVLIVQFNRSNQQLTLQLDETAISACCQKWSIGEGIGLV
jgi:hypothetical protein